MGRTALVVGEVAIVAVGVGSICFPAAPLLAAQPFALPSTNTILTPAVPLRGNNLQAPTVFRHDVSTRQSVVARIDAAGKVFKLSVTDRLTVGKGDFFFGVPVPAVSESATARESDQPLIRTNMVQWQGYSAGAQPISFAAKLRPADSIPYLPLKTNLETVVGGRPLRPGTRRSGHLEIRIRVVNATSVRSSIFDGSAPERQLARVLDRVRAVRAGDPGYVPPAVTPNDLKPATLQVTAPLRVVGSVTIPVRSISHVTVSGGVLSRAGHRIKLQFSRTLGDMTARAWIVHISGLAVLAGAPHVSLRVVPVTPSIALRPPVGDSWSWAVTHVAGLASTDMFVLAQKSLLQLALAAQYDEFLANPDSLGWNQTVYRFVTGEPRQRHPVARNVVNSVSFFNRLLTYVTITAALGLLALLALVAWARS